MHIQRREPMRKYIKEEHVVSILVIFILFVFGPSVSAQSDSPHDLGVQLYAGASHANITPAPEVHNWVNGEPYGAVQDSIFVRALVVGDGDHKVVFLHWELVDAGESATDQVRKRIAEKLNIPSGNILVNAAHNHSAPWAPVYGEDNRRGKERYPWWVTRHMPAQDDEPHFREWKERLLDQSVAAAVEADRAAEPATVWVGRYDVSRFLRNRRPRPVKAGMGSSGLPEGFGYKHDDWDPRVLSGDHTFGPMDRTMTAVSFRNRDSANISTLFHLACHAVSVYPYTDELSDDWPGATTQKLNQVLGGNNLFLQGAAGNINPWRRGEVAVQQMTDGLVHDISVAYEYSAPLIPDSIRVDRTVVGLPLTDYGQERTGLDNIDAEIMGVVIGPLALVTLPGEPMTELNMAIQAESPYPQTIVLGYSNGNGGHYCGMPGEKAHGGYETGERTNLGSDQAGLLLVKSAIGLLDKMYVKSKNEGDE